MSKKDELLDIYDENRRKTGEVCKRSDKMESEKYRLVVHVCIFNSQNQLLIQQRQTFRSMWPNMWDLSAAGGVLAGENTKDAASREVWEELGLKIDFSKIQPSFTINFDYGFDDYFFVQCDCDIDTLKLQPEEVQSAKWADKEEVLDLKEKDGFIPYWFLDKLWEIKEKRGSF